MVLELAKWLAANWHSSPSNEGSPKEACLEGREVEEPSRAIGQKKVQKAREDEPGDNSLREFWDSNPEDEFGDCVARHSCGQAQLVLESVGCDSLKLHMLKKHGHCWPLRTTAPRAAPAVARSNSQPWPQRCPSRSRRRCHSCRNMPLLLLRRLLRLLFQNERLHR